MACGAAPNSWGTSSLEPPTTFQAHRVRLRSNCSSTNARNAARKGQSSTFTEMASSYRRHPAWSAASATRPSLSNRSRRSNMDAQLASDGRRCDCRPVPFPSTCTMFQWSPAIAATRARPQLAALWMWLAASVGSIGANSAKSGQRMEMNSSTSANTARTTRGASREDRRRKARSRRRTWNSNAKAAKRYALCKQKSCFALPGMRLVNPAIGRATQKFVPWGASRSEGGPPPRPQSKVHSRPSAVGKKIRRPISRRLVRHGYAQIPTSSPLSCRNLRMGAPAAPWMYKML
mmetsp:Transcript_13863/g.30579  ORF Transcript_13863/g.30579 Transcript_13863/m.30579 type:complete len:290 (+) Transcript_13863:25-894(+)